MGLTYLTEFLLEWSLNIIIFFFLSNKVHNSLSKKFSNQTGKYDTRTSKGFFQRVSSSDRVLIVNISQLIYWKNIDNSQNGWESKRTARTKSAHSTTTMTTRFRSCHLHSLASCTSLCCNMRMTSNGSSLGPLTAELKRPPLAPCFMLVPWLPPT